MTSNSCIVFVVWLDWMSYFNGNTEHLTQILNHHYVKQTELEKTHYKDYFQQSTYDKWEYCMEFQRKPIFLKANQRKAEIVARCFLLVSSWRRHMNSVTFYAFL